MDKLSDNDQLKLQNFNLGVALAQARLGAFFMQLMAKYAQGATDMSVAEDGTITRGAVPPALASVPKAEDAA